MLFEFTEIADHGFWMKDVKISLDIIFLNIDNRIVHIHQNARPMDTAPIYSGKQVARVIEANGGWCQDNNVVIGTEVGFTFN
jgi:uncharacterized membrane protein (UPF0127 family)